MAAVNSLKIDYVRKKNFRKEDKVKAVLKERGTHPDCCGSSRLWSRAPPTNLGDKPSRRTYLRYDDGKCRHQQSSHCRFCHSDAHAIAGDARLTDLEERAPAVSIADANLGIGQAVHCEVFTKLSE